MNSDVEKLDNFKVHYNEIQYLIRTKKLIEEVDGQMIDAGIYHDDSAVFISSNDVQGVNDCEFCQTGL